MGKEDGRVTEFKKKTDLLDYGAVAVGYVLGLPALLMAGAFAVAMDHSVSKEFAKKADKIINKFKRNKTK